MEDASDQIIYRLFTELQKLVSYDPDRLNILVDIIRELNPEQQAIIWTKYHKERDYIIDYLKSQGESFSIFDGKHKQEDAFKQKEPDFWLQICRLEAECKTSKTVIIKSFTATVLIMIFASKLSVELGEPVKNINVFITISNQILGLKI